MTIVIACKSVLSVDVIEVSAGCVRENKCLLGSLCEMHCGWNSFECFEWLLFLLERVSKYKYGTDSLCLPVEPLALQ